MAGDAGPPVSPELGLLLHGDVPSSLSSCPPLHRQSLVREPLSRRRQLLRENFVETEGEFVFATSLDTKDTDQIAEFLEQSVKGEGVWGGPLCVLCPPARPSPHDFTGSLWLRPPGFTKATCPCLPQTPARGSW